jgi:penicillin amidase
VIRRVLKVALVLVLVLVVAVSGLLGWVIGRGFPQREGTARLAGLSAEVTVVRDAAGIPQVYASTAADLFMAQGWLHASERMWQMEIWRRIGAGRLSELFGRSQLDADTFIRTLGWRRAAERDLAALSAEARAVLDAYAAGVNAYLDTHGDLPLPFVVAGALGAGGGLSGYHPEPWTALDTTTWQKVQAWNLGANWESELFRMLAIPRLGAERIAELTPAYRDDRPVLVPCGLPGAGGAARTCEIGPRASKALDVAAAGSSLDAASAARLRGIAATIRGLSGLGPGKAGPIGAGGLGSNSWAVAPAHSATGTALLANDPHLGVSMPSLWYVVGLHCAPKGKACPFDMAGAGFPGVPGLVLGHNDRIAWGLTNVGPDVQDLVMELQDSGDGSTYKTADGSARFETRTEKIGLGGGETVDVIVRESVHGPIISDVVDQLKPRDQGGGGLSDAGVVYALRWTALAAEDHTVEAILGVNRATDWTSFREALRSFGAPAQTFLYADVEGHIGLQIPGLYPIRRSGDGSVPVPGWDLAYEWTGYVPFDDLPYVFDPPSGVIVTANNAPVSRDFPYFLGVEWDAGYRAARVAELLAAPGLRTTDEFRAMQGDAKLTRAAAVVELSGLADGIPTTGDGAAVTERILAWATDGPDGYTCGTDSVGCAAYEAFEVRLLRDLFDDELGGGAAKDSLASMYVGSDLSREALRALLGDPTNAWWDDVTTPGMVETSGEIIRRALGEAGAALRAELGDPDAWTWGRLHSVRFDEATLGKSGIGPLEWAFDRGPFQVAGDCDIVDATCGSISALYPDPYADEPEPVAPLSAAFAVRGHPSYRLVVDMGALDGATIVQATGESGVPFDAHYGDWTEEWLSNSPFTLPFTRAAVDAAGVGTLVLTP